MANDKLLYVPSISIAGLLKFIVAIGTLYLVAVSYERRLMSVELNQMHMQRTLDKLVKTIEQQANQDRNWYRDPRTPR